MLMSANSEEVICMQLNERKLKILEAIIKDYILTAEAIGSRTISKKYDLGVSAATIRNEMSDLEEMGFLTQPHTSSGRVPSEQGYKLYVNTLMQTVDIGDVEKQIVQNSIINNLSEIKNLLDETLKLLSKLTNCTSIALTPQIKESKIKHLQIVYINSNSVLLVVITDTGIVKNNILSMPLEVNEEKINILSKILSDKFLGKSVRNLDDDFIRYVKSQLIEYSKVFDPIFENIFNNILEVDDLDIITSGATNIFNFPEFNDIVKAKAFLNMLEKKQDFADIINTKGIEKDRVNIIIGGADTVKIAKDCSIITATCDINGIIIGKIGIIGPTRMDYSKCYPIVDYIGNVLNEIIKKSSFGRNQ